MSAEPPDVAASYFRLWNIPLPLVEDTDGGYLDGSTPSLKSRSPSCSTRHGNVSYVSVGGLSWEELDGAITTASTLPPRVLQ